MASEAVHASALMMLGDLHAQGRDPIVELAYYRSLERRAREGKETVLRLR